MNEEQIYIFSKTWFKKNDFIILGGQPPSGSDNIPVIEIKNINNLQKGSKGSYKPDLILQNKNNIIIAECKPFFNKLDNEKLNNIIFEDKRKETFFIELKQKKLFKFGLENDLNKFLQGLRYCQCFFGNYIEQEKIVLLKILDEKGTSELIQPKLNNFKIIF